MKKQLLSTVAAVTVALIAARADAKVAAVYASGHAGVQNEGNGEPGLGFMLGGRVLIFDGYADYTRFGERESVSRGIVGLRGGFGQDLRLVLRGGAGAIREEGGALTGPLLGMSDRTGGVVRAGVALEAAVNPLLYLGFGLDTEHYRFASNTVGMPTEGSDVFAALRATFELGI